MNSQDHEQLRAAHYGASPLDDRTLFLCDLVEGAEVMMDLGLALSLRQRLDRGRGAGAAAHFLEEPRDTSTVLGLAVPTRHDGV
ncbi:hypothetical protein WEB32_04710 [Streptomyces netropsis]|uniref:Uncharacterized protein n=1 Tax=Streptomyces netropsis TaxID=55404 RepID=A0A7W7LF44_STRNE|nr:hypothetical protein [Streptomyces netropsis]MBB4889043.1 hypothetical protein [Streptomyces netropsis]GGR10817.1 hypothetical protein GCM10010219_14450 [Streptomyces netropsis]